MRLIWIATLAVTSIGFAATPSFAGHPQEREGFFVGVSIGGGGVTETCGQCSRGNRDWGPAGDARVGWAVGPRVLLGPEVSLSTVTDGEATLDLYGILGVATVYPRPSSGFFLKGGLGTAIASYSFDFAGGQVDGQAKAGLAFKAGAGYDFRVAREISLTPGVTYLRTKSIQFEGDDVLSLSNFKYDVVAFTIGITFH